MEALKEGDVVQIQDNSYLIILNKHNKRVRMEAVEKYHFVNYESYEDFGDPYKMIGWNDLSTYSGYTHEGFVRHMDVKKVVGHIDVTHKETDNL